jgi:hypothetical protein
MDTWHATFLGRRHLTDADYLKIVLCHQDLPVAIGGIGLAPFLVSHCARLVFGLVSPAWHGRGLGTALLLSRISLLPEPKPSTRLFMTNVAKTKAFFRRFGFASLGIVPSGLAGISLESHSTSLTLDTCEQNRGLQPGRCDSAGRIDVAVFRQSTHCGLRGAHCDGVCSIYKSAKAADCTDGSPGRTGDGRGSTGMMTEEQQAARVNLRRRRTAIAIQAMMGIVFFYGLVRFFDAPLHPCPEHGYCGKQGQPHTEREYKEFEIWQTTLIVVWPIGMLTLYLLNRGQFRRMGRKP